MYDFFQQMQRFVYYLFISLDRVQLFSEDHSQDIFEAPSKFCISLKDIPIQSPDSKATAKMTNIKLYKSKVFVLAFHLITIWQYYYAIWYDYYNVVVPTHISATHPMIKSGIGGRYRFLTYWCLVCVHFVDDQMRKIKLSSMCMNYYFRLNNSPMTIGHPFISFCALLLLVMQQFFSIQQMFANNVVINRSICVLTHVMWELMYANHDHIACMAHTVGQWMHK